MKIEIHASTVTKNFAQMGWAIFLAILLNSLIAIEWSHPYCNILDNGPAQAAFGFPFPYMQWTGVSSIEYTYMPSAYVLNILILSSSFFYLTARINEATARTNAIPRKLFWCFGVLVSVWDYLPSRMNLVDSRPFCSIQFPRLSPIRLQLISPIDR